MRRVGFLGGGSAQSSAPYLDAFRAGMLELHWVEGRDYVIETRLANGVPQALAPGLGLRIAPIELKQAAEIKPTFRRVADIGAQACVVTTDSVTVSQEPLIAEEIIRLKLPSMFAGSRFVEAGGLMSYAASPTDNFRRAAGHVDKILKGAKPGDLPVEQPTKFELVVNLKTAKAIGIAYPKAFVFSVDRVIE